MSRANASPQAWAANAKISISPRGRENFASGIKKRLMTTGPEDGYVRMSEAKTGRARVQGADSKMNSRNSRMYSTQMQAPPRRTLANSPGIAEPLDFKLEKIVKNKNESKFTSSLISGDQSKYCVGYGIEQEN